MMKTSTNDVSCIVWALTLLARDYLRHGKMIGKLFDPCLNLADIYFCSKWHGNGMSHVTTFFIWELKLSYIEGGDIFLTIFHPSKAHQNLNNNQYISQSFSYIINSHVPAVLVGIGRGFVTCRSQATGFQGYG